MWKKIKKLFTAINLKFRGLAVLAILVLSVWAFSGAVERVNPSPKEMTFTEFLTQVEEGSIEEVVFNPQTTHFSYEDKEGKMFTTDNPKSENFKRELLESNVKVIEDNGSPITISTIMNIITTFVFILIAIVYIRMLGGKKDPKSLTTNIPDVNFETVAGNKEAKEEMEVIVDFLKNPEKFQDKGAKLPKGALFYGPPGTGKTLMARAVAGQAGVPFLSISGSDFSELYVGSGARKVRNLFEQARKKAPSIIFIDEIDAVGSSRSGESNSEYKQTLNALLAEMDGFNKDNIVVIAATNRLEDLDSALIRPGRFDKQVAIGSPDKKDRLEIMQVHAKGKTLAADVDLEKWSKLTIGFAGADLASMMNEAAILSVVDGREEITNEDLDNAHYKMIMKGNKKKNQKDRNEKELEIVAWHEAGHALLAKLVAKQSVPKVTILSSTSGAGGVTFITPSDNNLPSKEELEERIITLYGGRVAEQILLKDKNRVTAGASQDIKEATRLIRLMLTEFGMSKGYGMINPSVLMSNDKGSDYLLNEAITVSHELYSQTEDYLMAHTPALKRIAEVLLEKETINEDELDEILTLQEENEAA